MLYWLYEQAAGGHHVPILNLLKYLTFRTGMALFTAQLVVVLMGSRFIRWMQTKQGKGQPIRSDGIERHIIEKAGTPTMGGVMILAGLVVGTLLSGPTSAMSISGRSCWSRSAMAQSGLPTTMPRSPNRPRTGFPGACA